MAADKGTATFSDVANAIALERGFWLGDAFASGGSNGYDHKAMGITAKGAWISVQRHFLEMGIDVQERPGDGRGLRRHVGDVFGNGMLLSKAIKLVAAFDHRHIFIDPDPDPAKSCAERKRMFELPRSSWDDYDPARRCRRAEGSFPRSREIDRLSKEAKARSAWTSTRIDPTSLITAILKAPGRPPMVRRDRDLHQGLNPDERTGGRPGERRAPRRCARRAGERSSAKARTWPSTRRAGSSLRSTAGASTPTSSTIRPASVARTMGSTSRSRSTAKCARGGSRKGRATSCWPA